MGGGLRNADNLAIDFDLRKPNVAYVNIQHPSSGVDRTIQIQGSPSLQRGNE